MMKLLIGKIQEHWFKPKLNSVSTNDLRERWYSIN